ncbi:MAG TPA: glutamate racemase [Tepidisphaeraceae bacterium]|jgi:glutamate racemase|nr:glutamate racemase [Tepidisphaeraceae bacterium]
MSVHASSHSPLGSPIVVLDSGLGGLTVVRALRAALPLEQIVYFGDTARLPYGSKTAGTVQTFVKQIVAHLLPLNPKHVVIACNTATALALPAVRAEFPTLSISGVIDPGAKAAVMAAGAKAVPVIGVMATEATVKSKAYERAIHRRRSHAKLLLRPAPLLVPIIEEGRLREDPLVRLALRQYLKPLMDRGLDVLVLGCTHYPILKDEITAIVGPSVRVIDSAEQCAADVARRLQARGLRRAEEPAGVPFKCFVTDDPDRFARLGSRFLGVQIEPPTLVSPDDLYATPGLAPVRVAG